MSVIEAGPGSTTVWLDDDGLLRSGRAWVALPDNEWRIVAMLLQRQGHVVWRDDLVQAVWPGKDVSPGALRGAIIRLRRRVKGLGVEIQTVRGRGFILTIDQRGSE
jgi:DNA-binding winged helix-turn-helix (wHTH) protein